MNTTFQIESIFPITGRGMYISAKLENEDNRNSYCDCNIGGIPILGWDELQMKMVNNERI